MVSQAEPGPEHLVVYDTAGKALLVKVLDPTQMVELPPTDAKDYFVQKPCDTTNLKNTGNVAS